MTSLVTPSATSFYRDVDINRGDGRGKILEGSRILMLSLDKYSSSGFQSKNEYLFGRFDMKLKLIPGNSAGTVTTFFLASQGPDHDEIDYEFLGNASGQPYTVHTNVYSQGKGNKEQQFHLRFDPSATFHTYSIVWNSQRIIFLVDNIPIRVFSNNQAIGIPFPANQPMRVYCSLWITDDWVTQVGESRPIGEKLLLLPLTGISMPMEMSVHLDRMLILVLQNQLIPPISQHGKLKNWMQREEIGSVGFNKNTWFITTVLMFQDFLKGFSAECKRSRF